MKQIFLLLLHLVLCGILNAQPDTHHGPTLEELNKKAREGDAAAQNLLGFKYYNGEDVIQNVDSALYWISLAAEKGNITAAANLGFLFTESPLIPKDEEKGIQWLGIAAKGGVRGAELRLVELMEDKWRNLPSDSILSLGLDFYTSKAHIAGVKLFEIAAEENNPQALALLGDAYSKGLGVPYNHQKSVFYFYKAAILGNPSARFILAELLDFFPDALSEFKKDYRADKYEEETDAAYWYEKAAAQGVTDAETAFNLLFSTP